MLNFLRLRYGLLWSGKYPPISRMILWLLAVLLTLAVVEHVISAAEKADEMAEKRLFLASRLNEVLFLKMDGSPCTLPSDFEGGKCIEINLKPIYWRK